MYVYRFGEKIRLGSYQSTEYFNYLQVQRDLADAIAQEAQAVANYNTALSGLEFAKGTITRYNNVTLAEGPLPPWVGKRAADHIRERTEAAIKVRERAAAGPGRPDHVVGPPVGTPFLGQIPPFAEPQEPVPDALPLPRPVDPKRGQPAPEAKPTGPDAKPDGPSAGAAPRPLPAVQTMRTPTPVGQPLPMPTRMSPPADGTDPGNYFSPVGTVTLPPRGATGPARPPAYPMAPAGVGEGSQVR
jgi:hypothetical protein